jgi:hypothetical protein
VSAGVSSEVYDALALAACEILVVKLPQRKYPMRASAAKLARLAVAQPRQKRGFGTYMFLIRQDYQR